MTTGTGTLAIIAGGGSLPYTVARAARRRGRDVFVIALDGFADKAIEELPHRWLRISQAAEILKTLRSRGCRELVLIGNVHRPARWKMDVGLSLAWLFIKNLNFMRGGDSSLLSKIVWFFEREGFSVVGAHEVAPELVLAAGALGRQAPRPGDEEDIGVAVKAALRLGVLDIGQGVVVARRRVLAVEAAEGTDAMLERVAGLRRGGGAGKVGVLVKCPQPIQDLRIDMPTIGPDTVRRAAAAGLAGILVVADRTLAVDIDALRAAADELGLFVVARDIGAAQGD